MYFGIDFPEWVFRNKFSKTHIIPSEINFPKQIYKISFGCFKLNFQEHIKYVPNRAFQNCYFSHFLSFYSYAVFSLFFLFVCNYGDDGSGNDSDRGDYGGDEGCLSLFS